jgi:hypothetical protein
MPPQQMMQHLTEAEIRDYNRSAPGRSLSEEKFYLKVFLLNDKKTNSADHEGGPWKVATRAVKKIASTVVGRPLIIYPDPTRHFRGASGNPEEIIALQQKWAIGEFVQEVVNLASLNAYGIVEVFKEFVGDVKQGLVRGKPLPQYVSPLVEPYKMEKGEVVDGRILHVQAVDIPGFSPALAKIVGKCDGMLGECMNKLRNLGAAGKLKAWQQTVQDDAWADIEEIIALGAAGTQDPFQSEEWKEMEAEYNQGMMEAIKLGRERAMEEALDGGLEALESELDSYFGTSSYQYRGQDLDFDQIFTSSRYPEHDDTEPGRITRKGSSIDLLGSKGKENLDYDAIFASACRR